MNKPLVTDSFLQLLEKSQLLSAEEIQAASEQHGLLGLPSAKEAARRLVKAKLITAYQAERLLAGRYRGFLIDRFKVLGILGFGGMGRIYVALDTTTGEEIALKILTERHEVDASMLERLKLEARAGLRLDDPHVVRTLEIGHTGAVTFVVMEYVRGITLHEVIATTGKLPWRQACDAIAQAALGLHHAHEAGLVHRDVKPANVLISTEGEVKVLDFGLALLKDEPDAEFALAMIFGHDCLGTADYISPEQSLHSHDVDARADVYSLGCTLYFTLTGSVPFPLNTVAEKLVAQRIKMPPAIALLAPDVPAEVINLVAKMMAKRPEDRFQSALEAANALAPYAQRLPVPFDFQKMMLARAREASRRMKAQQKVRPASSSSTTAASPNGSASGASSSITARGAISPSTQRMQQQLETDVDFHRPRAAKTNPAGTSPETAAAHVDQNGRTATMRAAESSLPAPSSAVLVPTDGSPPIVLNRQRMELGRDASCDIRWDHQGVSAKHCEFCFEGNWWKVTDLNSKNGVQVNGLDVSSRMLLPGDRLTIARLYQFEVQDPNAPKVAPRSLGIWYWLTALLLIVLGGALAYWLS